MQIVQKKIEFLKPYPHNPRNHTPLIDKLAEGIKQFGFKVPILARSDGIIVDGVGRYKAALKLGLKLVPVIIVDDLTEEQQKAFRISVNQLASLADWDLEKLEKEIHDLNSKFSATELAKMTAFGNDIIEGLLNSEEAPTIVPEMTTGIYQLTNNIEFPVAGPWDLPQVLPAPLYKGSVPQTWLGPNTPEADTYLYIFSTDSPATLDWQKTIVGFWTNDGKLERVWTDTAGITQRFLDKKIKAVITPDFSCFADWPMPLRAYNLYRNLYCARYFQTAGIPVIINVCACYKDIDLFLHAIPPNGPLAFQIQANYTKRELTQDREIFEKILDYKPCSLWLYGSVGNVAKLGATEDEIIKFLPSRMSIKKTKIGF